MHSTHRRRLRAALVGAIGTALLAAGLIGTGPTAPAQAATGTRLITIGSVPVDLTFNEPAEGVEDLAQLQHLARLIDDAPAGSTIRAAIYSLTASEIYDPLERAKARGVRIQAVVSSDSKQFQTSQKLATLLGPDFHWCDHGDAATYGEACISTDPSGIMHAKYWLFSATKDSTGTARQEVTWISSSNQTHSSGTKLFNNTLTYYGDHELYTSMGAEIWTPMWEERSYPGNDFYVASGPRGIAGSDATASKVYASPEQTTDLVLNRLDYVTPDANCRIRVMQNMINDTRGAVVDKVVALKKGGCKVWVVAESIGAANLKKFTDAGISVRHRSVHDKAFIISARYAGSAAPRPVILTGSHNLSESALKRNDELLLKVSDSQPLYDAFYDHFNAAYNTGTAF